MNISYKPSKQRAEETCLDFRKTHLEPVPFVKQKHFLDKPRLVDKELGHTFRFECFNLSNFFEDLVQELTVKDCFLF